MKMPHARRRSRALPGSSRLPKDDPMKNIAFTLAGTVLMCATAFGQGGFFTTEEVIRFTPEWHGERFADGRPKVPDNILDRMKKVTLEEAWATLREAGFNHQYEDGWLVIHPDQVLVGRALTAVW